MRSLSEPLCAIAGDAAKFTLFQDSALDPAPVDQQAVGALVVYDAPRTPLQIIRKESMLAADHQRLLFRADEEQACRIALFCLPSTDVLFALIQLKRGGHVRHGLLFTELEAQLGFGTLRCSRTLVSARGYLRLPAQPFLLSLGLLRLPAQPFLLLSLGLLRLPAHPFLLLSLGLLRLPEACEPINANASGRPFLARWKEFQVSFTPWRSSDACAGHAGVAEF